MYIRSLEYDELDEASRLIWLSFYYYESKSCSMEGIEAFRNSIEPMSLKLNKFCNEIEIFGAFDNNSLVGVGAMKKKSEISLLFVHKDKIGSGIGRALLNFMTETAAGDNITVKASAYGEGFYKKCGFTPCGERKIEKGINFLPMCLEKKKSL